MKKLALFPLLLFLTLFLSLPAFAREANDSDKKEIKELRQELEGLKHEYEKRIKALEDKLIVGSGNPVGRVGTYQGRMNPDISVVVDGIGWFTDDKDSPKRNKFNLREAEFAAQGAVYPGVQSTLIAALEQEYAADHTVETEVHLEEAYLHFMNLPWDMTFKVGRMFTDFGKLNKIHQHHRPFVDQPQMLDNLFTDHPWFDDGALLTALIPNPADLYLKAEMGFFNGRNLEHSHTHDDEDEEEAEPVDWNENVFLGRIFLNLPLENGDIDLGYSVSADKHQNTILQGVDLTFKYRWPMTFKRFLWQNEFFTADIDDRQVESNGFYSLAKFTLNQFWEMGARYDWAENLEANTPHKWGYSAFVSYYLTETTLIRGEYKYTDMSNAGQGDENTYLVQFVWGLGAHSHRLDD